MPRKKPFSGKQKKLQLQEKRDRKGSSDHQVSKSGWKTSANRSDSEVRDSQKRHQSSKQSSTSKSEYDPRRYILNFLRETREEIEQRKHEAQTVQITYVSESEQEVDIQDVYQLGSVLDMPKRPKWKYTMSKQQVEQKEEKYFQDYLASIHDAYENKSLSYFEHNLETWRQAWRVVEMSDIVVMVTDVRHPVLHFSPALYDHVVKDLNKPLVLVLNKIDLVPASVIAAWTTYFKKLFPFLHVVWFTSFPQDVRTVDPGKKVKTRRKPKKRVYSTQIGPKELLQICQEICGDKVDLKSWATKIENDLDKLGFYSNESSPARQSASGDAIGEDVTEHALPLPGEGSVDPLDGGQEDMVAEQENNIQFDNGILTLGFVGHPNVGKSSLMNGLIGHKVVSTSVTPGHTKYFQTYFLTKTVKLCDSPGLVFPSLIPKQLQILSGIYPIAQVQEPYTPVGYLAARIPLVHLLQLQQSKSSGTADEWTAWDICEAWANKRNYRTAKAARPDVYRAANSILRMAVDGRLSMFMRPPGYNENREYWEEHENTAGLLALQATGHFHGGLCYGEGRHAVLSYLNADDMFSSDTTSTADDVDTFSNDDESETDDDGDVTLSQDNVQTFSNKFQALACDDSD